MTAVNAKASNNNPGPADGSLRSPRHNGEPALLAAVMVNIVEPEVVTLVFPSEQVTFARPLETEQDNATAPEK